VYAVNKISILNGNWNSATTWLPLGVPANGDVVVINSNVTINANTNRLNGLTINAGFTLNNSGFTLKIDNTTTSNFTNNGTYTDIALSKVIIFGNFTNNGSYNSCYA